jgi:TRAP-type C4-dicarboxylate transport system permease large subunit
MADGLVLLLMVASFAVLAVGLKLPMGLAIALAAAVGAVAGGQGLAVRHLVEGAFGFFDIILIIATAMVFIRVLQDNGLLDSLVAAILRTFFRRKVLLLLTVMLLLMFPGMITGSSLAAVLSTGPLIAPVLVRLGLSPARAGAFVAMGAILGMIAPPVNILVMIMGAGVDMPYVGLTGPLFLVTVPAAIIIALGLGLRHLRVPSPEELAALLPPRERPRGGILLYAPVLVVLILMVLQNLDVPFFPTLGLPAIFTLGSLAGLLGGRRFNVFRTTQKAVAEAGPILSILVGVGMFIQVMTLTGGRGWLVMLFLSVPSALLYAGLATGMPLFGGVSAFGSASVLGVPFLLAFVGKNAVITASALSAVVGLGDLMPPAAMAARFSAQVVGEPNFFKVIRHCLLPALLVLAAGLGMLLGSTFLDTFL